jgi:hypothetical protein
VSRETNCDALHRESIAAPNPADDDCELEMIDPDDVHAPNRRSEKEINRLLDLLDSLSDSNLEGGTV